MAFAIYSIDLCHFEQERSCSVEVPIKGEPSVAIQQSNTGSEYEDLKCRGRRKINEKERLLILLSADVAA